MSDSEPDYKSRLNSLNKLTIVSGAKSQVQDAQGNLKRKYARRNIRIPNNKSEKLADTFGTPLKASKIKSGDFTDNMKWNVYKTDVEPKLMNRMVENDDENMKRIVEAALADENIQKAEIKTVDQAILDRQRENQMRRANMKAKQVEYLSSKNDEVERLTQETIKNTIESKINALTPTDPKYDKKVEKIQNSAIQQAVILRKYYSKQFVKQVKAKNIADEQAKKAQRDANILAEKQERAAERASIRDATRAKRAAQKAEEDAKKAEKAARQAAREQAEKDAKVAKIAEKDKLRQERINTEKAQQSEIQAKRAAAKAKYDAKVAKRQASAAKKEAIEKAKPGAATLIQNAFRSKKARDALTTQKQKAEKYNEFLGEREVMKSELKSKAANLRASYGENLFPRAKVGRPPGSTNKSKQRTGAKTVIRGMVAKGKKPTP